LAHILCCPKKINKDRARRAKGKEMKVRGESKERKIEKDGERQREERKRS
jgi:hypothetical protein